MGLLSLIVDRYSIIFLFCWDCGYKSYYSIQIANPNHVDRNYFAICSMDVDNLFIFLPMLSFVRRDSRIWVKDKLVGKMSCIFTGYSQGFFKPL